jgi:hypothetical protein
MQNFIPCDLSYSESKYYNSIFDNAATSLYQSNIIIDFYKHMW